MLALLQLGHSCGKVCMNAPALIFVHEQMVATGCSVCKSCRLTGDLSVGVAPHAVAGDLHLPRSTMDTTVLGTTKILWLCYAPVSAQQP